jgi:hypothetical protein
VLILTGWDLNFNSEYIVWGLAIIFVILLISTGILSVLYFTGNQVELFNLDGSYFVMMFVILLLIVGSVVFSQYYMSIKTRDNIIEKIHRREFVPINYQYGRNSEEISNRLHVAGGAIHDGDAKPLQEIWENLMKDNGQTEVRILMKQILSPNLNEDIDVLYNLLWYLCISEDPFRNGLNKKEKAYVLSLDNGELRKLIGDRYEGATDRASLIFVILSGQVINLPYNNTEEAHQDRYNTIKQYDVNMIYNLSFGQNNMIDHTNGLYSTLGPYTYLSLQPVSHVEDIIVNITNELPLSQDFNQDFDFLVENLGIGPIHRIDQMSDDDKISYLRRDLSSYHNVFSRQAGTSHPVNLKDIENVNRTRSEMLHIMSYYTNKELIDAYEPRDIWLSRSELFRIISDDVLGGPKWSIRSVSHCNNDDTVNIITCDTHGDCDKHDIEDPTLSYGIHKNYRCYQASELEASFRYYDGVFRFAVPDWSANAIDPITQTPLAKEFTIDAIKNLQRLLKTERLNYNILALETKVNDGLELMKSAAMQTRILRQQFNDFTFEQKQTAELYMAWMFTYSMWMRFWMGPGHPWPLVKANSRRRTDRNGDRRSSTEERDEHISIQEGVRSSIIEIYEQDPILKEWIESLPTIYYDFDTGDASCATHMIKDILDQIALGTYCMGFGSDTILKTSYYYITALLNYPQGQSFDGFITRMLPRLLDLEYTIVSDRLQNSEYTGIKRQVLNSRDTALQLPTPRQSSFDPATYQNNIHTD